MTRFHSTALAFILALATGIGLPRVAQADLKIVATTADLAAVAREIGGDHAEVQALALPTQDPHWVDARPHLALELARADLVLVVGLDLEVGWLPTLLTGSRNSDIQAGGRGYLDCSQFVELMEVPTQRLDRSMGDVHAGGNPHYMADPRRVVSVTRGIARRMASLDPDNAALYGRRANAFVARLNQARQRWERDLADLRGQKIVGYHRSFPYLAEWLGVDVVVYLEPRPGIPPNPRHVARVLGLARSQSARLIVQESYYPTNVSEAVAERANARLVRLPGGPNFRGGESYIDYMNRISRALRGR